MVLVGGSSRIPLVGRTAGQRVPLPDRDRHPPEERRRHGCRPCGDPAGGDVAAGHAEYVGHAERRRPCPAPVVTAQPSPPVFPAGSALSTAAVTAEAQLDDALGAPPRPNRTAAVSRSGRIRPPTQSRAWSPTTGSTRPAGWLADTSRQVAPGTGQRRRPALDRPRRTRHPTGSGADSVPGSRPPCGRAPNANRADRRCGGGPAGRHGRGRVDPAFGQRRSGGRRNDDVPTGDAEQFGVRPVVTPLHRQPSSSFTLVSTATATVSAIGLPSSEALPGNQLVVSRTVGRRDRPVPGRHRDRGLGSKLTVRSGAAPDGVALPGPDLGDLPRGNRHHPGPGGDGRQRGRRPTAVRESTAGLVRMNRPAWNPVDPERDRAGLRGRGRQDQPADRRSQRVGDPNPRPPDLPGSTTSRTHRTERR